MKIEQTEQIEQFTVFTQKYLIPLNDMYHILMLYFFIALYSGFKYHHFPFFLKHANNNIR